MLCAKIDKQESDAEISLIKSKTDEAFYNKIYDEFCCDEEDCCFEKIEDAINQHEYSPQELSELKKEILEVFNSDDKFVQKERYLEKVFDTILY